jgi:hypothetical protein
MNFFPGEYDAGASSAGTRGRTTQRLRTNPESRTLAVLQSFEADRKQKRKDHTHGDKMSTRDLGV